MEHLRLVFPNESGEKLVGDLTLPGKTPDLAVVVCHGFLGTRHGGGRAVVLAEFLAQAGYPVFRFDFAGSGESEGSFAEATLTKNVADLRAAVTFLGERGFRRFVILGRSHGGNAALAFAAADLRAVGVVLWSTPRNMATVLRKVMGERAYSRLLQGEEVTWVDSGRKLAKKPGFLADLSRYPMDELVARLSPRPLLIVHGEEDELVPAADARTLFSRAGEPRELVLIPGGDHHLSRHQEAAREATLAWLKRHFPLA